MILWTANSAKARVRRHDRILDRIELKEILKDIYKASCRGYDALEWRIGMREGTVDMLKKYGYEVERRGRTIYCIMW